MRLQVTYGTTLRQTSAKPSAEAKTGPTASRWPRRMAGWATRPSELQEQPWGAESLTSDRVGWGPERPQEYCEDPMQMRISRMPLVLSRTSEMLLGLYWWQW